MQTYIVRMWLPDRPGALGQVASRIGAVRGDVVGIDILERGAGRAIDELTIELADEALLPLLVSEIGEVDGVDVEDVRPAGELPDARLDALDAAAVLVEARSSSVLMSELVTWAHRSFEADWAAAVDVDEAALVAVHGAPPTPAWVAAFVGGTRSSSALAKGDCGPDDCAWAMLGCTSVAIVLGRKGRPFRSRERRQLGALARIAGVRADELSSPANA